MMIDFEQKKKNQMAVTVNLISQSILDIKIYRGLKDVSQPTANFKGA